MVSEKQIASTGKNLDEIVEKVKKETNNKKIKNKRNDLKKTKKNNTKKETKTNKAESKTNNKVEIKIENKVNISKKKISNNKLSSSDKKKIVLLGLVAIMLILVFAMLVIFPFGFYKYSFPVNGIYFLSNEHTPTSFVQEFRNADTIYISPLMVENKVQPLMVNSLNLWQVVSIMNGKQAIQLIRVADDSGNIQHCYTNNGDPTQNELVEVSKCLEVLNDNEKTRVLIEEGRERVMIEKNKVTVFSSIGVMSQVNFIVISEIFPNAQEALDIINQKIYGIN